MDKSDIKESLSKFLQVRLVLLYIADSGRSLYMYRRDDKSAQSNTIISFDDE